MAILDSPPIEGAMTSKAWCKDALSGKSSCISTNLLALIFSTSLAGTGGRDDTSTMEGASTSRADRIGHMADQVGSIVVL